MKYAIHCDIQCFLKGKAAIFSQIGVAACTTAAAIALYSRGHSTRYIV